MHFSFLSPWKHLLFVLLLTLHPASRSIAASGSSTRGISSVADQKSVVSFREMTLKKPSAQVFSEERKHHDWMAIPGDLEVPAHVLEGLPKEAQQTYFEPQITSASPAPAASFLGLEDSNTSIPPDTHGCAGTNHLMVTLNTQVRIQNRSGGIISTVTLNNFWASLGSPSVFDPKVLYDPYNHRWMFTACANSRSAASAVLMGVSQTSDPTGSWNLYKIDADASDLVWADYPSIGFNKDWIVVQMNMFNVSGNAFNRSHIYVFNKSDLYSGGTGLFTLFSNSSIGGTQVPAITHDNSLSTMHLISNLNGNFGGSGFLQLFTITGAVGSETFNEGSLVSTSNTWQFSPNGSADFAPQLGTSNKIQNNDARMQNLVYRNGSLWTTHTVFLPSSGSASRSSVQWWQINPSTAAVEQFGRVDDSTGSTFHAFPSIAVNKDNDVLIGFSRFSSTQFASANYAYRLSTDTANTLRTDHVLKTGEATYFKTFSGTRNRWGDYSSTVVDPVDDTSFWTIQEYAATASGGFDRWGTWWGRVAKNSQPGVSLTLPANGAVFNAPANVLITAEASDSDGSISGVEFFAGSSSLGTSTSSPYALSWSNVTFGTYSLTAVATDNGAQTSTSSAISIVVNALPTVSVSSPANGATFTSPAIVNISAAATDTDGSIASVQFFSGGTSLGADTSSPYSLVWGEVLSGTYSLIAVATDNRGATNSSSAVIIRINSLPSVSISLPTNGSTYAAPATIEVNAVATDSDGFIEEVAFMNGEALLGSDSSSPYSLAWNNVGGGSFTLTARATDSAGGQTTSSAVNVVVICSYSISPSSAGHGSPGGNGTINVTAPAGCAWNASTTNTWISITAGSNGSGDGTVSYSVAANSNLISRTGTITAAGQIFTVEQAGNVPPVASISSPSAGASYNAPAAISITADVSDDDGSVSNVEFFNGATSIGADTSSPYSLSWSNVPFGTHSLAARATDNLGAQGDSSAVPVIVNSLPFVNISSPANGSTFTPPATLVIAAAASDADGAIAQVEFLAGSTSLGTDSTSPYSTSWSSVVSGAYVLTAVATDNRAVNSTSSAVNLTVNSTPVVSISSPANGDSYNAPATVILNASASDPDGSIQSVEFFHGTSSISADSTSPYGVTWSNAPSGTHLLTAAATDNLGGSTDSSGVTVVINALPLVSMASPANGATYAAPASIPLNATATDVDGNVVQVEFYNGATLVDTDSSSPYSFTWSNVASGSYSLSARATDNRSATSQSGVINVAVNAPPQVSMSAPANGSSFVEPANIVLSGIASDSDGTIVKVDFVGNLSLLGTDSASPYAMTWMNVGSGLYNLAARATDNLGGTNSSNTVAISVVTNTPPLVMITSPFDGAWYPVGVSIPLEALASDVDGAVTDVQFLAGATSIGVDGTSPYAITWIGASEGVHELKAIARDDKLRSATNQITFEVSHPPKGDIDEDGRADILWRDGTSGSNMVWRIIGGEFENSFEIESRLDRHWNIAGCDDFDGDGTNDILWRHARTGENQLWIMGATEVQSTTVLPAWSALSWKIVGTGDLNNDGHADILWHHSSTGKLRLWLMDGTTRASEAAIPGRSDVAWSVGGIGDFNGDGSPDILWRNSSLAKNQVWYMNGLSRVGTGVLPTLSGGAWKAAAIEDYNDDGAVDIVWRHVRSGTNVIWMMDNTARLSIVSLPSLSAQWMVGGPR